MKSVKAVYLRDDGPTQDVNVSTDDLLSVVFTVGVHNFIVVFNDNGIKVYSTTHELTIKPVAKNMVVIK